MITPTCESLFPRRESPLQDGFMRVAIVGAGGVGGLLAGLLARAGNEVGVVARGGQLAAIRSSGLEVDSPLGRFTIPSTSLRGGLSADPRELRPVDAVLVAVKAWQVEEVAPLLLPLVSAGGVVIPLENGVLNADRLAAALGAERVAGGLVSVIAWIDRPGRVKHLGARPRLVVGERGHGVPHRSPRLVALSQVLEASGCEASVADDIERASWEKYLLVEPWGTVSTAARAPIGAVRAVPETREILIGAMRELVRVGRARGVAIPDDAVERALVTIDAVPTDATASMQRDLASGRHSELYDQPGALVRMAREAGVPVPIHETLYSVLLPMERAARGGLPAFTRT